MQIGLTSLLKRGGCRYCYKRVRELMEGQEISCRTRNHCSWHRSQCLLMDLSTRVCDSFLMMSSYAPTVCLCVFPSPHQVVSFPFNLNVLSNSRLQFPLNVNLFIDYHGLYFVYLWEAILQLFFVWTTQLACQINASFHIYICHLYVLFGQMSIHLLWQYFNRIFLFWC